MWRMSISAHTSRLFLLLFALAVAAVASHAARAAGEVTLAWKLEKGATLRYTLDSDQEATQRLAGSDPEGFKTTQRELIEYRLSVLDVDPVSGTARVLCRYERVQIDLNQMMLGMVKWDSRDRDDVARADEPAVKPFARLVGQEFSFLLSPSGDVADVIKVWIDLGQPGAAADTAAWGKACEVAIRAAVPAVGGFRLEIRVESGM